MIFTMLKKSFLLFLISFNLSCQDFGNLKVIADLQIDLNEVSGIEYVKYSKYFWMVNDGGNKPKLYAVSSDGKVKEKIDIDAKNHDWEDLASDEEGNIYIGDFGNNESKRENLRILKVDKKYLSKKEAKVSKIKFFYEDQNKFPPKKNQLFFDAEAFFYFKNNFYVFTKSRVKDKSGLTFLYKVPAEEGTHKAKKIGEYNNCNNSNCWITSADISSNGEKVVLLSQDNILVFSNFKGDNFFSGKVKSIPFTNYSQKESIVFKDLNTVLISDEKSHGNEGMLYEHKI